MIRVLQLWSWELSHDHTCNYNVHAEHSSEQDDQQLYDEADYAHDVETVEAESTGKFTYKCTLWNCLICI